MVKLTSSLSLGTVSMTCSFHWLKYSMAASLPARLDLKVLEVAPEGV